MYSIVQKEGLGLDKAIEEVKHRMSRCKCCLFKHITRTRY